MTCPRLRVLRAILPLTVIIIAVAACEKQEATEPSPELQAILAGDARAADVDEAQWEAIRAFYTARDHRLAWSTANGPAPRAGQALEVLRAADAHGLSREWYGESRLTTQHAEVTASEDQSRARAEQLATLDVHLTAALLELGKDVAVGRHTPAMVDSRWNIRREPPDYVAALQRALSAGMTSYLDDLRPRHPEYHALQGALAALRGQADTGWPTVARASLKVGQWNRAVVALRQRLSTGGYLPPAAATDSAHYDADVEAAVARFQEHHALEPTGALTSATLDALNLPIERRLAQVAMNMERWRWMPDDLGARHFLVNVPYYHVIAREDGKPVLDIRVVVGKRGNETPLFSDEMTHVVFSPYWNIPESIVLEETAPAIARDPEYLSRNNMEVVDASGRVVPAASIPWGDADGLRGLSFRQRPGASNALGLVKFMFPNRHSVYLHDTPADALFSRIGRAFSHGCVRVEEPQRLAEYVLRDQPEWTSEAIHAAMRAGEERHVKLRERIPVHLVYFTAWVDANGGLHFQPDVYGYDARQARAE